MACALAGRPYLILEQSGGDIFIRFPGNIQSSYFIIFYILITFVMREIFLLIPLLIIDIAGIRKILNSILTYKAIMLSLHSLQWQNRNINVKPEERAFKGLGVTG